jgi:hypothetical protein
MSPKQSAVKTVAFLRRHSAPRFYVASRPPTMSFAGDNALCPFPVIQHPNLG